MKKAIHVLFALAFLSAAGCKQQDTAVQTSGGPAAQQASSEAAKTAVFRLSGLNEETVNKLSSAISDQEGLISAQANTVEGTFQVTYLPSKCDAQKILEKLKSVNTGITLQQDSQGAPPQPLVGHDCGNCPYHKTCEKKH